MADSAKHKSRVYHLYFIGALLQAKFKNMVFVKLDSTYADYFPSYSNYSEIALRLLKSLYRMTNSGKVFADYFTVWLIYEAGFKQSKY